MNDKWLFLMSLVKQNQAPIPMQPEKSKLGSVDEDGNSVELIFDKNIDPLS